MEKLVLCPDKFSCPKIPKPPSFTAAHLTEIRFIIFNYQSNYKYSYFLQTDPVKYLFDFVKNSFNLPEKSFTLTKVDGNHIDIKQVGQIKDQIPGDSTGRHNISVSLISSRNMHSKTWDHPNNRKLLKPSTV